MSEPTENDMIFMDMLFDLCEHIQQSGISLAGMARVIDLSVKTGVEQLAICTFMVNRAVGMVEEKRKDFAT